MRNTNSDRDIERISEELAQMDQKLTHDMGKDELAALMAHDTGGERTYFRSKRIFYKSSVDDEESGWYFTIREGSAYGPFPDEQSAIRILQGLIQRFLSRGDTGGRQHA